MKNVLHTKPRDSESRPMCSTRRRRASGQASEPRGAELAKHAANDLMATDGIHGILLQPQPRVLIVCQSH
ncbi:hypothetical protein E2C01_099381 [Portunus trituberculatus]|uniref:Uncharacterized protein n=1 Tax=Portunus trituberculatus TaxID=210409 RepID=A0A5B7K3P4_PORTR|nr:hypothetical protein [Portunus trituberculatus]